jgi:hypothetical protein
MGQGTFIIFIDTPVDHIVWKCIQSNVNWKTNANHCWGNRKGYYLKATHIECRKHLRDSAHNTSYYADMTGDVALISSDIFNWRLSKSAKSVWNTLLIKRKNKPTDNANGVTKKCCKCLCCWKRGEPPLKADPIWTADERYLLWPNDIHSWNQQRTYFMFCLGLLRVLRKSKWWTKNTQNSTNIMS